MYLKRYYLLSLSMTLNCIVALISICRNCSPTLRHPIIRLILPFCPKLYCLQNLYSNKQKAVDSSYNLLYGIFSVLVFGLHFYICLFYALDGCSQLLFIFLYFSFSYRQTFIGFIIFFYD